MKKKSMFRKKSSFRKLSFWKKLLFWEVMMTVTTIGVFIAAFFLQGGTGLKEQGDKPFIISSLAGGAAGIVILFIFLVTMLRIGKDICALSVYNFDHLSKQVTDVASSVAAELSLTVVAACLSAMAGVSYAIFIFTGNIIALGLFVVSFFVASVIVVDKERKKRDNVLAVLFLTAEAVVITLSLVGITFIF